MHTGDRFNGRMNNASKENGETDQTRQMSQTLNRFRPALVPKTPTSENLQMLNYGVASLASLAAK